MKTIWKFPFGIEGYFTLQLPAGAQILHVEVQNGAPCLWVLVDPAQLYEPRQFRIYGTGHPIDPAGQRHVATFQMPPYVWHLFEVL